MRKTHAIIVTLIILLTASLTAQVNDAKPSATAEIHTAAAGGDLNKVRALLEADPTLLESKDGELGFTLLHSACWAKQAAVANYLIDKGANVNARDYFQMTPLHRASFVAGQDLALIQRLIDKGAEVNAQAGNGLTPLHWAAHSGDLKVARLLIDHGADVNTEYSGALESSSISGTVLQVAINYGPNEEMAKWLVENGAKLNRKDSSGNTELHLAALKGYADLVRLLVKHGAEVNAMNEFHRTALYYAAIQGYRRAADALIAAGAKESAIVETNYGKAPQLSATLKEGEAYLWKIGYFGYAVKTKGHLILFNPRVIDESLEAGLANGHLNPNELAGQKIIALVTEPERRQHGTEDFELAKRMPGVDLVVSHKLTASGANNPDIPSYRLAVPNESFSVSGIQVHTIPALAGGMGYLVEADGVKVFHAGLHVSDDNASNVAKFRKEIDFLKPFGPIDVAILSVHSHSNNIGIAYEPYLYLLDQLSPKAVYLLGANIPEEYTRCAEVLRVRNIPVTYPEGGIEMGERFHYLRDQASTAPPLGTVNSPLDYLGQTPPGKIPVVFARGIVSTDNQEHSALAFSPDGNEVFWSLWRRPDKGEPQVIMTMRREGGTWSAPAVASFSGKFLDGGPVFSANGRRIYFYSTRPTPAGKTSDDIWFVEKQDSGWGEPHCLGFVARFPDMKAVYQPSVTRNGTLYFISRPKITPNDKTLKGTPNAFLIYRAELINDEYPKAELLPQSINAPDAYVNWTPFIAPDESYLIFSSSREPPRMT